MKRSYSFPYLSCLFIIYFILIWIHPVHAGTYYVDISQASEGDGSALTPWKTLHNAIQEINNGPPDTYTLNVAAGTYSVTNGEADATLVINQDNVTIQGAGAGSTIINGIIDSTWQIGIEINASNVTIAGCEVSNFTMNGINIYTGTGQIVEDCDIHDNDWGIYTWNTSPEISKNKIYDNTTRGIYITVFDGFAYAPVIKNNLIYTTTGTMQNGIDVYTVSTGSIASPSIYHNTIDGGTQYGIYILEDVEPITAEMKYNIITNFAAGISFSGTTPSMTIDYNDVYGNTTNYNGCTPGTNDISLDPSFVGGGDYHLQSGSPCIDAIPTGAGDTVTEDLEGNARPQGLGYDMGCYEYLAPPQYTWTQVNSDGFGDVNNTGVQNMVVYNNRLYLVTSTSGTGCEIWEYDGTNWVQVNTDGFGDANNWHAIGMAVHNNRIYVGTSNNTDGAEVWEYDGANWVLVNTNGFGDANNRSVDAMAVYNDRLYAGTFSLSGAEVWEYFNASWTQVNTDGFGDANNTSIESMAVYNGNLYVGTDNAEVWEYDGAGWNQVNTDGFGDTYNWSINRMVVFNNSLYAGTYNPTNFGGTGGEVWEYDGAGWNQVNTDGFGDGNNTNAFPMAVFNNRLYAGTGNPTTGGEVWEYDGESWTQVGTGGFGDVNNSNVHYMTVYNGILYAGTFNDTTGAEVWEYGLEAPTQYTLTVYIVGQGSVDPAGGTYNEGTVVTLTAVPYSGCNFMGWSGALTGSTNPETITMNADKNVTATFNCPPDTPTASSPEDEAIEASGDVTLQASPYFDADNDPHTQTHWRVRRADELTYFHDEISTTDLTVHTVSGLWEGMKYFWQVGYEDSEGNISWSAEFAFKIGTSMQDGDTVSPGKERKNFTMISFTQWPDDPSCTSVMSVVYNPRNFRIGAYNPGIGDYIDYGGNLFIVPGRAYWILARNGLNFTYSGVPVSIDLDLGVILDYNADTQNGWNQIGCPNAMNYYWGDVQVLDGTTVVGTLDSLAAEGDYQYIDIRIWKWENGSYVSYEPDDNFLMEHCEGYWVKANKANISLRFRQIVQVANLSTPTTMLASILNRGKRWMKKWVFSPQAAVAASGDSPPLPMGDFSTVSPESVGGCFIATAVYGSPMERHVRILRNFRDTYLLNSAIGHMFVKAYYRYSPPVADFIAKHRALKAAVRICFLPMVAFCYSALHFGLAVTVCGLLLIFMPLIFFVFVFKRGCRVLFLK